MPFATLLAACALVETWKLAFFQELKSLLELIWI